MKYPLRNIHQIEMTSRCNLRCKYCAHPHMPRPKQDMSWDHFERSIYWAHYFHQRHGVSEVNLAGIGESTLHPELIPMLAHARKILGDAVPLILTTNGLLVDDAMCDAMAPYNPRVFLSLHRPERAQKAFEALKRTKLLIGVSSDAALAAVDWAGQVDWPVTTSVAGSPCPWVTGGWGFVLATGDVSRCCFDATGVGIFAHVNDDLTKFGTSPYKLCATCHMKQEAVLDAGVDTEYTLSVNDRVDVSERRAHRESLADAEAR